MKPNSQPPKILASVIMIIIVAAIIIIGDSLLIIRHTLLNFYGSILVNEEDFIYNYNNNRVCSADSAYKTCW